ncbi:hypothetical protein D3C86_1693260 [compost metagenome]
MVGHFRGFKTTALVYTHIDHDGVWLHPRHGFFHYNTWAPAVRSTDGPDHHITGGNGLAQHNGLHDRSKNTASQVVLQAPEAKDRTVEHLHFCAQGYGRSGGIFTHSSGTQNNDLGWWNPRKAAQHQSFAAGYIAQVFCCNQNGGCPHNFTHGAHYT